MKNEKNIHPRSVRYTPVNKKPIDIVNSQSHPKTVPEKLQSHTYINASDEKNVIKTERMPLVKKPKPKWLWRNTKAPKLQKSSELNVLSLGAGVQSSTLLLMSLNGDMPPLDYVIFADTGWEPRSVYDHLEKLKTECRKADLPLITVRNKNHANIAKDPFDDQDTNSSITDMPLYIRKKDGDKGGMIQRRCTGSYKVRPISKMLVALRKETKAEKVRQWIGISYDELHRMKINPSPYVSNYYPLVEKEIDRNACQAWLKYHGWWAPKSSCVGCPYHSEDTWLWLKNNCPDDFNEAVQFDKKIRIQNNSDAIINGDLYLHRARIPLEDVVFKKKNRKSTNNFGQQTGTIPDKDSLDDFKYGFGNECEGLCGV